jgi:hypothetical protein
MDEAFERLPAMIFGDRQTAPSPDPAPPLTRKACLVQVGFDFGTAFSKCVCRDIFTEKAWVHLADGGGTPDAPFLIPSTLTYGKSELRHTSTPTGAYEEAGLHHVKMALQRVALGQWDDPVLRPFREVAPTDGNEGTARFVEGCAVYLLAGALGGIRRDIRKRFPGDVPGDSILINMAVPVADASHPEVNALFDQVLRRAWVLADELPGHPPIHWQDLDVFIGVSASDADAPPVKEACKIYPEVGANVQGFVRSRTSREGIYLFSDTGAGTVDQSLFIFTRREGADHLCYLHADVIPLGSSQIERRASRLAGTGGSWEDLEQWRRRKEQRSSLPALDRAKEEIADELGKTTLRTICLAKKKLIRQRQINDLRIIFGGGGHCEVPYRQAVLRQFEEPYFTPEEIRRRQFEGDSFDLGMPIPPREELPLPSDNGLRWMNRLSVAYGLSFLHDELSSFTLPDAVEPPDPKRVWRPQRDQPPPPSKDDC